MGKDLQHNLQQQHANNSDEIRNSRQSGSSSSNIFCESCCSLGFASKIVKHFNFKCFLILILSLGLLISVIFWILPHRHVKSLGFDADIAIKLSASVQGYFKLEKPVSQLVPHIGRLEYDINEEIGVPNAKVVILSMHQSKSKSHVSNCTDVVLGFLSDPVNVPINQVSLSVLRASFIELLLHGSNLSLTTPIFGQPSVFEILKFPGGITVIPTPYASILQMPQTLFNFTLNNPIADILENLNELTYQLKFGLHLTAYENIVVQITNAEGSTVDPPVIVEASVVSDLGNLLPQRLKQLVQTISDSPSKNLGLDHSVFGKVKSVVLSSYLKGRIHANPPTPSPAPSPEDNGYTEPPNNSPAPSVVPAEPPQPCRRHISPISRKPPRAHSNRSLYLGPLAPPSQDPPDLSALPPISCGSGPRKGSVPQSHAPSPSAPSLSSIVKAYFRLQKPVLQLVPHIRRLEYDLKKEIGIPTAKVVVLSLRPSCASNCTDVVFGVLPERSSVPVNQEFLSVLRWSLIDVFLQKINLTLTTSIFGQPSAFEILKFPGGISVYPVQIASICQMPQILFSFSLNHSIADILYNLNELRDQLKFGLHLKSHENIIVQLTNSNGSTMHLPAIVQASVVAHLGVLRLQRLKHLAQTIRNSHLKNLGLDYSFFGEVRNVILSSYLEDIRCANSPKSSPAPSPELHDRTNSPSSKRFASSPSPSAIEHSHSHPTCLKCMPHHSLPHVHSSAPSVSPPSSQIPSDLSPLPQASYSSTPTEGSVSQSRAPSPSAPSPSSVGVGPFCREIWWLGFSGLLVFHILCYPH